jgi:hypothetical protein
MKIYRAEDGWRIKGWTGTSPTKKSAQARYKSFFRRTNLVKYGLKAQWEQTKARGGIIPSIGAMLSPDYKKTNKQIAREFAMKIEKRRRAEVKALKQKKITAWW